MLSYPVNSACAFHGECAVPVQALDGYLHAYRTAVPPEMFNVVAQVPDLGPRLVPAHPTPGPRQRLLQQRRSKPRRRHRPRRPERPARGGRTSPCRCGESRYQLTAASERRSGTVSTFSAGSPSDGSADRPAPAIADEHIYIHASEQRRIDAPTSMRSAMTEDPLAKPTIGKDVMDAGGLPPEPTQAAAAAPAESRQLPDSAPMARTKPIPATPRPGPGQPEDRPPIRWQSRSGQDRHLLTGSCRI